MPADHPCPTLSQNTRESCDLETPKKPIWPSPQKTASVYFTQLHFTSLHFTTLYFTLLYFTLLYFTSPLSLSLSLSIHLYSRGPACGLVSLEGCCCTKCI